MRILNVTTHPDLARLDNQKILQRNATRAIILKENDILLLYTERYQDYSLPGGGIDDGEDILVGLVREIKEETGARNICNIQAFGIYEEFRPWYKHECNVLHMISYCYTCDADQELGDTNYEEYEIRNGMKPMWINIHDAIAHNEDIMANSDKKGMSIERETFLLRLIVKECLHA